MEKVLRRILYNLPLILIVAWFMVGAVPPALAQKIDPKSDMGISFPANLNAPDVDFNLKLTGKKKFKIVLEKKATANTKVKIYDILGNLIKEDKIVPEDGREKNFDFSNISSELFVVEVGNSKYNKTKSIYAQSPGVRKKLVEASE